MINKQTIKIGALLLVLGVYGILLTYTINNANIDHKEDSNITMNHRIDKSQVVNVMYLLVCPECDYDKAEGNYSMTTDNGYERCPVCRYHIDIENILRGEK